MSFSWPVGKLDLINSALAQSGDNLCATADDGSDEWNVASPTYERALAILMEDSNWGFATKVATLNPSPTAPTDTAYDTAYPLPSDLVHLVWVKINQNAAGGLGQPVLYDILAGQLVVNSQGGPPPPDPPQTPSIITIKYVSNDNADPTMATPLFVAALQTFVMSGIYRGLHGDDTQADRLWQAGEGMAQRARSRYDQQKPKRAFWNSRISAARRIRRPWPPTGNDSWSGSGTPG